MAAARAKTRDTTASRVSAGGGLPGSGRPVGRLSQPPAGRQRAADPRVASEARTIDVKGSRPHDVDQPRRNRVQLLVLVPLNGFGNLHALRLPGPSSGGGPARVRHAEKIHCARLGGRPQQPKAGPSRTDDTLTAVVIKLTGIAAHPDVSQPWYSSSTRYSTTVLIEAVTLSSCDAQPC